MHKSHEKTRIGIVDDQKLFLNALTALISTFDSFEISVEAINGKDLIRKLEFTPEKPSIVLVDYSMPIMNGPETARYLTGNFPSIRVMALSMKDDVESILAMLKAGCCAYCNKDISGTDLEAALVAVNEGSYFYGDLIIKNSRRLILKENELATAMLTPREQEFLDHACSDLTYKEIAYKMRLAERTIDGYREALFAKFEVKSRQGMVLEALRRNLIQLEQTK